MMLRVTSLLCLSLVWLPFIAANAKAAIDPPVRVTDQRSIELADSQILAMSPDGQWLAAIKDVFGDEPDLCVHAANTLTERLCVDLTGLAAGIRPSGVTWSPNSRWLVFDEEINQTFTDGDLWLLDVATGTVTHLTDDGYEGVIPFGDNATESDVFLDSDPTWSPDSTELVFVRAAWQHRAWTTHLVRLPIHDGSVTPVADITSGDDVLFVTPRWSADGHEIVYSVTRTDYRDSRNGVWTVGIDGSGIRQLSGVDPERGAPALAELSASGDQALLFYERSLALFTGAPWTLLDLNSGKATDLEARATGVGTPEAEGIVLPALATFSPDGTTVLLASWAGTLSNLWLIDAESADTSLLIEGIAGVSALRPFGGLTWATNDSIYVPTDFSTGLILEIATT